MKDQGILRKLQVGQYNQSTGYIEERREKRDKTMSKEASCHVEELELFLGGGSHDFPKAAL